MKRRRAIELISLAAVGAVVFPACEFTKVPLLDNFELDKAQYKKLKMLSAQVLPIPEEMILKEMGPADFTLIMMDDCEQKEDIVKFKASMDEFFVAHQKIDDLTEEELSTMLDSSYFLQKVKQYNVSYYTGLENYLNTYTDFEFVPGRFIGCVKV